MIGNSEIDRRISNRKYRGGLGIGEHFDSLFFFSVVRRGALGLGRASLGYEGILPSGEGEVLNRF